MMQILMQRVICCVIYITEQAQPTDLLSLLQATKFILAQPFRPANSTIQQSQMRLRTRHPYGRTILQIGQSTFIETALEHTRTIK